MPLFVLEPRSLTTNDAPVNGTLRARPMLGGFSLTTNFTLATSGWVDGHDDLPLLYAFNSVVKREDGQGQGQVELPLSSHTPMATLISSLPQVTTPNTHLIMQGGGMAVLP